MTTDSDAGAAGRVLEAYEADLLRAVLAHGDTTQRMLETVASSAGIDQRAAATAKTHLQTGLMWLRRAITRPEHF